jgi:hypothetical protein
VSCFRPFPIFLLNLVPLKKEYPGAILQTWQPGFGRNAGQPSALSLRVPIRNSLPSDLDAFNRPFAAGEVEVAFDPFKNCPGNFGG